MDITLVIEIGVALTALLAILIFLFFSHIKKRKIVSTKEKAPVQDLNSLIEIIKNKQTSTDDLKNTLDLILRDHGEIHDFNSYLDILYRITLHPNTNKDIIINFDKELSKRNPNYKEEISKSVTDALNFR
jgi:hypothetical protein